ncbi:unnamed protein product [Vitrella brassicaformis CCMP3155]|uniref:Uncharacterized protein n=1 Tax=Vitrella brassicaformis (strain CCMP3155) TaxID=1169540 RepID=A0A0G4H4S5_VITBC|nr:unnamed protein product [Vitrella brassicaformis CCMP3155]|eukprot:CEM38794.1 unnamed protein product [Vitrella brassicaformis CCMP3155]
MWRVGGVVRRPEINGLEGRVGEVLPPHTQLNKSDVTRYRVSLSVCATHELSLRGDNVLRIPRAARDPLSHLVASLTGMHIN